MTLVTYKAGDARWAIAQLSSGKAGPCTGSGGPADKNKFGGAVAEPWKAVVGQRAQAPLSACAQAIAAAWTETAAKPCSAGGQRRGDHFLLHCSATFGKAWAKASVRPLVPAVAKVAGPCQFGSLPGRSTRDAVAVQSPSKSPQLSSRMFLV